MLKLRDDLLDWSPFRCKNSHTPLQIVVACLNLGPDFFDYYKQEKREAMLRGMGAKSPVASGYLYGPPDRDWWDGPDSWFDMRFTIFWELKSDDSEYMFNLTAEDIDIDPDTLEEFRSAVSEVIPNEFSVKEDLLGQYNVSSAKSFLPDDASKKTVPEWLANHGRRFEDNQGPRHEVKGTQIPKCAGETRDGVTLHTSTKRMLTKCGHAIRQLLDAGPYRRNHPSSMTSEELDKRLTRFSDRYAYFFCKDFAKIGLTLPIDVAVAVLEACYSSTRYEPFIDAISFFKDLWYYSNDSYRKVVRGYCLGLFNEGMTLVQLAMHHLTCANISRRSDGMFLNDDSVVGFADEIECREYAEYDEVLCDALCIPRKDTKSFISEGFFRVL
jgi:hypothetical protein